MTLIKKQWVGIVIASSLSAFAVLGITRLMAPQLLGLPMDLEVVQVSDEVVPFFETVLNEKEINGTADFLKDPYFKHRGKPLKRSAKGDPYDILGFRNLSVPSRPHIITIGDSQTLGHGVAYRKNWPSQLAALLNLPLHQVYNMSVSGWGAVDYYEIAKKALLFKPKVIIVAFYSGNDPLDSFMWAYAADRWKSLRAKDLPETIKKSQKVHYPPKKSEMWTTTFPDGVTTVMTPYYRYSSNSNELAPKAGYRVMANVAKEIVAMAAQTQTKVLFTAIPTKELAFAKRVKIHKLTPEKRYKELVEAEPLKIAELQRRIKQIDGANYQDVVAPLQNAILNSTDLHYGPKTNGHPKAAGFKVIAEALKPAVKHLLAAHTANKKSL